MRLILPLLCLSLFAARAQVPAGLPPEIAKRAVASPMKLTYLPPVRVLWTSDAGVERAENLLLPKPGQSVLKEPAPPCVLRASDKGPAGILLDFGVEVQGFVELFAPMVADKTPAPVRIRFGESAAEAMAEIGERGAQNDHAVRDFRTVTPWLGRITAGPSGFRFVRIDALDPKLPVSLAEVRAVLQLRDIPCLGSFACNDERINRIWRTGAYTVHLNMQDYLWDGIKRDRLVWLGDLHPEVATVHAVFGFNEVVPRSLDLIREVTPVTEWMNGISSYSMWWVILQDDLWRERADRAYLEQQKPYLQALLARLRGFVGPDGREKLDGHRFLDWPSSANPAAIHAGLQAMLVITMERGAGLLDTLGDAPGATACRASAAALRAHVPDPNGSKQAAALQVLAGQREAKATAESILKAGGPRGLSTFYGYYVLEALAAAGDAEAALGFISAYWGGMLDFGATTFWEDFDLAWTENAGRIDELVPPGRKDLHGDFGAYCYEGFRHSLCHGWASGPTPWLSRHVLGVRIEEPGAAVVSVKPMLGNLKWAEGAVPTARGLVKVRHERQPDGTVKSTVTAPDGVQVRK